MVCMKENNFAIMRFEKIKTQVSMTKSYNHNYRRFTKENANNFSNVDLSKIHLDKELIPDYPGYDYSVAWQKRYDDMEFYKNNTLRKDAVRALEFMMTFSADMTGKVDVDEWARINIIFIQEVFGRENVASVRLHLDESVPHLHIIVWPIVNDKRGERFCADHYIGDSIILRQLQSKYAADMEPFGLCRGISGMGQKHKSMSYLQGKLDAELKKVDELTEVQKNMFGRNESANSYAERIVPLLMALFKRNQELEAEVQRLRAVQREIINKDKHYQELKDNLNAIQPSPEDIENALLGRKIMKMITEHPEEKVRDFYKKITKDAKIWAEKQIEKDKPNFNYGE